MTEISKESENRIETLAMYKVMEGLIHNINTPLNLIIGYSQQLKKQYPEISHLDKINNAGLKIDEIVQACSKQMIQRLQNKTLDFELNQWVRDEINLLNNILDIKHSLLFEANLSEGIVSVNSNPLIMGLFFESIILYIIRFAESFHSNKTIFLKTHSAGNNAELILHLPVKTTKIKIDSYLSKLQIALQKDYDFVADTDFPFVWQCNNDGEIIIILPLKG